MAYAISLRAAARFSFEMKGSVARISADSSASHSELENQVALIAGTRVGPYEILSALGVGGMGEVYRARDRKLERDVAIKVLPELFISDPERVARFQREAKTLASLNHPHIGGIYGVEDASGVHTLVVPIRQRQWSRIRNNIWYRVRFSTAQIHLGGAYGNARWLARWHRRRRHGVGREQHH